MALPDQNLSTLDDIRIKVRRLTRSPSPAQLTDAQIDDYVNNFVLYDFPEFVNKRTLTFYTQPNVDRYETNDNANDPLYNFKNQYLGIDTPIFIDGEEAWTTLSEESFYSVFPLQAQTDEVATGDGVTAVFAGTIENVPILQSSLKFSAVDADNIPQTLTDAPDFDVATDYPLQTGDLIAQNDVAVQGDIDYLTGDYNLNFLANPPANGATIYASYFPYTASKPTSILFNDAGFTLRPVPDRAYTINVTAYVRPTELLVANDEPFYAQWWQYIAYGASKKVFEDRMDIESIKMIMPEFEHQRIMVQRREIIQQSIKRVPTIYAGNDVNKSQSLRGTY